MIRAYRVALAAGGPLWRTALGLAVLAFVIAVFVPSPDPDARARPEPGSPAANVNTVTLRVPKRELSGTLNIVDASGGELATLTLLSTGETAVAARRGGTGWGFGVYRQRNREDGSGRAGASDGHRDGSRRHDEDLHQGASHRKGTPGGRRDRDGTDELSSSKPRIASRDPHQRGLRGSRASATANLTSSGWIV